MRLVVTNHEIDLNDDYVSRGTSTITPPKIVGLKGDPMAF